MDNDGGVRQTVEQALHARRDARRNDVRRQLFPAQPYRTSPSANWDSDGCGRYPVAPVTHRSTERRSVRLFTMRDRISLVSFCAGSSWPCQSYENLTTA